MDLKKLELRCDVSYGLYGMGTEKPVLAIDLLYSRRFILFEDDAAVVLGKLIEGMTLSALYSEIRSRNGEKGEEYVEQTKRFLDLVLPSLFDVPGDSSLPIGSQADPVNDGSFVWKSADEDRLYGAVCELTHRCQLNCKHCYNPDHYGKGDLSTGEWLGVISQLREAGVFRITLTGGDPFARDDIWEIIEHIRSLSMSFDILTNGQVLGVRENAERLRNLYPHSVQCSVYSASPEVHDEITGVHGSFYKTRECLRFFKGYNVPTALKSPLLKCNFKEIAEIHRLANVLGATHQADLNITPKTDGDALPQYLRLSQKEMEEVLLNEDAPLYKGMEKLVRMEYVKKCGNDSLCGGGHSSIAILHDGTVVPCLSFPLPLGSITEKPIEEILKGERMKHWRDTRWKERKGKCVHCQISDFCSFCPGDSMLEHNGDYLMDNKSDCEIAEARKNVYDILKNRPQK